MAPECRFVLPTGHKCRCAATRHQPFCRHHGSRPARPPSIPQYQRYSRLARWSRLSRDLARLTPAAIPGEIHNILYCLLEDGAGGISDREAGRLLRGLLRRLGSVPFALPLGEMEAPPAPAAASPLLHPAPSPDPNAGEPFDPAVLEALLAALNPQAGAAGNSAGFGPGSAALQSTSAWPGSTSAAQPVKLRRV